MQVAADHQATVTARNEELKAIATAKEILEKTTSGAASETYSMLQVARVQSRADLAGLEVVQIVKQLARKHHSSSLAQLASRMTAAIRFGTAGGEDPFAKVKGLIESMIAKLEAELAALMKSQAEMDKIRQEENAAYVQAKEDLTLGLSGVRQALSVLRDYYASDASLMQQ